MRILSGVAGDRPCSALPASWPETIGGAAASAQEITGQRAPDQGVGPNGQVNVRCATPCRRRCRIDVAIVPVTCSGAIEASVIVADAQVLAKPADTMTFDSCMRRCATVIRSDAMGRNRRRERSLRRAGFSVLRNRIGRAEERLAARDRSGGVGHRHRHGRP
jgi:hypothetical protein